MGLQLHGHPVQLQGNGTGSLHNVNRGITGFVDDEDGEQKLNRRNRLN